MLHGRVQSLERIEYGLLVTGEIIFDGSESRYAANLMQSPWSYDWKLMVKYGQK